MSKRHFEFVEGSSSKFWEVWVEDAKVYTRYGKIGAAGQITVKETPSPEKAVALHDKLVKEKTGKGYQEKTAGGPPAKPKASPTSAPAADFAAAWKSLAAADDLPAALEAHLAFLCDGPGCRKVLTRLCACATSAKAGAKALTVTFTSPEGSDLAGEEWTLEAAPPFTGSFSDEVPASHRRLCEHHNGLSLDGPDVPLAFFGVNKKGVVAGGGFEPDYLEESDPDALEELTSAGPLVDPIGRHQDFVLYNFAKKNQQGEPALQFLSHEGGGLEAPYDPTLGITGIFLRMLAADVLGDDTLLAVAEEPAAPAAKPGASKAAAKVLARIPAETVWDGWMEARDARCCAVGERLVVVSGKNLSVFEVSAQGLRSVAKVELPMGGFQLNCLQPVGESQVFLADAEGHALVDVAAGKVLHAYSADWGRHSALLRGEHVLIDRYIRDDDGSKDKFAPADAETKALVKLAGKMPATGLAVQPMRGGAAELRHVSEWDGGEAWVDFGDCVVAGTSRGFMVHATSADFSEVKELKQVRTPNAIRGAIRLGDLVLGWNPSGTANDVNLTVLDVKSRAKAKLAGGLWKKTQIADVQVAGDRVYAAGERDKKALLLTARHEGGTLSEEGSVQVCEGDAHSLALVKGLAVVLTEDGGGVVVEA